jgi:hypothetical protein
MEEQIKEIHPSIDLGKVTDLTGRRFGRLTVLYRTKPKNKSRETYWVCKCNCSSSCSRCHGEKLEVPCHAVILVTSLTRGLTKSCGCYHDEKSVGNLPPLKHGMVKTPEYRAWIAMHIRCGPDHESKKSYYEKGIDICERWRNDNPNGFENFFADMGFRPHPSYSLDRKDNSKGYYKDNCRWADKKTQTENRDYTVWVTYRGERMTVAEAAKRMDVTYTLLIQRVKNHGYVIDDHPF